MHEMAKKRVVLALPGTGDVPVRAGVEYAPGRTLDVHGSGPAVLLPRKPTAVQWQTIDRPGTGEWTLAALLTFAPADLRELVASTPKVSGAPRIPKRFLSWFPPSLQQKFSSIPDEPPGFIPVEEAVGLSPEPFLGTGTSPLSLGRVHVLEGESLVFLLLSAQ